MVTFEDVFKVPITPPEEDPKMFADETLFSFETQEVTVELSLFNAQIPPTEELVWEMEEMLFVYAEQLKIVELKAL